MHYIQLSPRLKAIGELVPQNTKFVDVGTDHGYLPVWLLQHELITHAIAADLRPGPLDRARGTAARYEVTARISFRLCDGLSDIAPEEAETIAIAGMGGETMIEILAAAPWVNKKPRLLLLQPMSGQPELRQWLQQNGFDITKELLCREGRTIYNIIVAAPGAMPELTLGERWAGRQKQGDQSPLRTDYLDLLLRRADWEAEGLKRSRRASDEVRLREIEQVKKDLAQMKKEWLQWQQ